MPQSALLSIDSMTFEVQGRKILQNISFQVQKGQFIGLIGPNGAGKTTLLRCILGIHEHSGDITWEGNPLSALPAKERAKKIAFMSQNTFMNYPFLSRDVVLMGRYPHLAPFRSESQKDLDITHTMMRDTHTLEFSNTEITVLSGGERQRVLLAKTLAQEAELILLDEPAASLDISHQEKIFSLSQKLCHEGRTVIAAIHDIKTAARYCTHLILLKEGELLDIGTPKAVITSENLSCIFGIRALVYRNKITGLPDFYLPSENSHGMGKKVHVIGGGGSAAGVLRLLFQSGYQVSAGIFSHGDSDLHAAEVFGMQCITEAPFSHISQKSLDEVGQLIKSADFTVLCNMPFGILNYSILSIAKQAEKLVIIEDDPPETRDFTNGKALALYYELKKTAIITSSADMHEVLL